MNNMYMLGLFEVLDVGGMRYPKKKRWYIPILAEITTRDQGCLEKTAINETLINNGYEALYNLCKDAKEGKNILKRKYKGIRMESAGDDWHSYIWTMFCLEDDREDTVPVDFYIIEVDREEN